MRMLTPVVKGATLAMFDPRQNLALRGAVALQFIRNYHPGDILAAFEQLAEELFRVLSQSCFFESLGVCKSLNS
jgi:hypothetical protein